MNKNFYFSLPERSLDSNTWSDLLLFPLGKTNLIKINVIPQSQYFFHVVPVLSSGWCVYMWGEWLERIFRKMLSGKERDHSSDQWNFHRKENWSDLTLSARNLTSGTSYILLVTLVNKLIWKNIVEKIILLNLKNKTWHAISNWTRIFTNPFWLLITIGHKKCEGLSKVVFNLLCCGTWLQCANVWENVSFHNWSSQGTRVSSDALAKYLK